MPGHSKKNSKNASFNADLRKSNADIRRLIKKLICDNPRYICDHPRSKKVLQKSPKIKSINRVIDANINRTKEGLRVCEEITRFIFDNRVLTGGFKKIRHKVDSILKQLPSPITLLKERESLRDVGRNIHRGELKRKDLRDIFLANIQRVKESLRVLEEFSKLKDARIAVEFKKIRYSIYEIEKKVIRKIPSLCNHR